MSRETSNHWAHQKERGSRLFLVLTRYLVRYCPAWLMRPIVIGVVSYFYLSAKQARQYIAQYQSHLMQVYPELRTMLSKKTSVFKQFYAFADSIVDRFAVWQGKIVYSNLVIHDPDNINTVMNETLPGQKGQIFICSHLGNIEICRALAKQHSNLVLNVLMHSGHAVKFNEALNAEAGAHRIRVIQVADLDASLMMQLNSCIERGEWLAIAADRVPIRGEKTVQVPFLDKPALWPQGPWLLAGLLKVPVNTLFCLKRGKQYHLYIQRFESCIVWKRGTREQVIRYQVSRFADILAQHCQQHPWQWFNFYSFWDQAEHGKENITS